jgi:hypothetical protein
MKFSESSDFNKCTLQMNDGNNILHSSWSLEKIPSIKKDEILFT